MLSMDRADVEKILVDLDGAGCLFPEFELYKSNNQPQLLGKGGFSVVYEMFHRRNPLKHYALKVIGFERHVVTSEQFWNTARLQYLLCEESPYVMRILDALEWIILLDEDGNIVELREPEGERWNEEGLLLQFILMEKLEDVIIKDKFKRATVTRDELGEEDGVIRFAMQIGQAIQQAHSNCVLHRDIKLENIFWDEEEQCYKLGDFGIAKFVEGGNAETVVYTDGYGAPEIERRLNDYYNATADIYSFGITLYLLLNKLRFPGSEGYYVNMVQYDPQFVFPAPENASEAMTRVIRKMCNYNSEDRYQSMAEVLMDLNLVGQRSAEQADEEYTEVLDLVTETYREEKPAREEVPERERIQSRAERKLEQKAYDMVYNEYCVKYMAGLTLLITLVMCGFQKETTMVMEWQFWVLPIAVLIEGIFLRIRELHIVFGGLTIAFGIYAICEVGWTAPHVLLLLSIPVGIPIVPAAAAMATGIWMLLAITGKLSWFVFIGKYDLGWILVIILFVVLNRLMHLRIDLDKISYKRGLMGMYIFDKMFLVMTGVGILLLLLQCFEVLEIPEGIKQLHLVRTGMISFGVLVFIWYRDGFLDDESEAESDEDGEEIISNDLYMDERRN